MGLIPMPDCRREQGESATAGTTNLLIDPNNPTGYAQVFEESDAGTGAFTRSYVLGDDVLSQSNHQPLTTTHHLLYDGHGSTRLLTDTAATPTVTASYDFDAYGNALGFDPTAAATSLLYAGEYLASNAGQYYLRARHYDTANGRFNREDPFAGNNRDPQSLHKYAYAHNEPVSNIDPSGQFTLLEAIIVIAIVAITIGALIGIRFFKQSRTNASYTSGSTPLTVSQIRFIRTSIALLRDASTIPNSGVTKGDVDGLEAMLDNGLILMLPDTSEIDGFSDGEYIYVKLGFDESIEVLTGDGDITHESYKY